MSDEAVLCVDGARAARALGFRYPGFSTDHARQANAAVGAPAHARAPSAALRGQLGYFLVFDTALAPPEAEACYEAARTGRLLYEQPRLLAAWHPLIADRTHGTCVAATADGAWPARPRSESISVVEIVRARDSVGGMLNILLPLLSLSKAVRSVRSVAADDASTAAAASAAAAPGGGAVDVTDAIGAVAAVAAGPSPAEASGDAILGALLRLLAALLRGHPRNQAEMLRSSGMELLGHVLTVCRSLLL